MPPVPRARNGPSQMDSIYVLIPVTLLLLGIAVAAYLWSVNSGQFDDLDKAARSILFEDENQDEDRSSRGGARRTDAVPTKPRDRD